MKTKLIKVAAAALLAAAAVSAAPYAASSAEKILPYNGETGTAYPGVTSSVTTHTYDFSETDIKFYSSDTAISTASLRTNMIFDGNTLSCKPGKTFSFGSADFLGDDYGIYGGKASFRFEISGGELSAGVRLSKKSTDNDHRGIWFSFDDEKITVSEPVKSINVTGTDIPSSATASWYTFNITGTDQISEGYAVDDYGITNNFGMPDSTEYFRGRIFKVDGKDTYGVLVPNGYGHSIINDKNESLLGAGDLNLKIGDTIFKK